MSRKRNNFDDSLGTNMKTYWYYVNKILELSIAMFKWENLPDSVDERFLELNLMRYGKMLFFRDEDLSPFENDQYLTLKFTDSGRLDVYGIPTVRHAYADNGYQNNLTNKDSVVIYNNMLHTNSFQAIEQFAKRLYNLDRVIDVNANAQKTPILIKSGQKELQSLKNLYMQYDGNSPVIYADTSLNTNDFQILSTQAPYVADKLYALKTQIWNDCLTSLGISNVGFQKKERLISDEVSRSQGGTIANRYSRLNARKQACEQINLMYGLNIDVNFRTDNLVDFGEETEVEDNE